MSRVRKHCLLAAAAVAVAVTPIAWRFVRIQYKVHAATSPQPATIEQHTEITGPNAGKAAVIEVRTIALRSDGSRADIIREPRKGWIMRRLSFADGKMQTVYDEVKSVSTSQLSAAENQNRWKASPEPSANCATPISGNRQPHPSVVLGRDSRFGLPVVKIRNESNLTLWMAPSLGCVALDYAVDWDSAHPGTNTSVLKLDSVTLGEPNASLFDVPATYAEMLPSQAEALHLRYASVPESGVQKLVANVAATDDRFYASHRPPVSGR